MALFNIPIILSKRWYQYPFWEDLYTPCPPRLAVRLGCAQCAHACITSCGCSLNSGNRPRAPWELGSYTPSLWLVFKPKDFNFLLHLLYYYPCQHLRVDGKYSNSVRSTARENIQIVFNYFFSTSYYYQEEVISFYWANEALSWPQMEIHASFLWIWVQMFVGRINAGYLIQKANFYLSTTLKTGKLLYEYCLNTIITTT